MSRDGPRPQEGARADRRAVQGELANARQKELSDRALRILEELSSVGRQVNINFSIPLATAPALLQADPLLVPSDVELHQT